MGCKLSLLLQEQYDMCYSKCVAQETDKVVAERAQVFLLCPLHLENESLCAILKATKQSR